MAITKQRIRQLKELRDSLPKCRCCNQIIKLEKNYQTEIENLELIISELLLQMDILKKAPNDRN